MNSRQSIINQILREYQKAKHFDEMTCKLALEKAMQNQEFSKLSSQYNATVLELARATKNLAPLENKLLDIRKKQCQLLKKLKLPDVFEPNYICADCKDTGYFGDALCACVDKKVADALKHGHSQNMPKNTFSQCDLNIYGTELRPIMQNLYQKMQDFAKIFPEAKHKNILFCGNSGVGKTFLVSCIFNAISERGFRTEYLTAFKLNSLFLQCHTSPLEQKHILLADLLTFDLLCIDDLGTEPVYNNVTREYLFNLINERELAQKSTIISTNLNPKDILDRYGERINSRLCNKNISYLIKIPGSDLRQNRG